MPRVLVLLMACVLALPACGDDENAAEQEPTPTETATPPTPRDCGQVTFTPQSDHGAFEVRAVGTSCATARAVAKAAETRAGSFTAEGFSCTGRRDTAAQLPSTDWTCTGPADQRVTFTTS